MKTNWQRKWATFAIFLVFSPSSTVGQLWLMTDKATAVGVGCTGEQQTLLLLTHPPKIPSWGSFFLARCNITTSGDGTGSQPSQGLLRIINHCAFQIWDLFWMSHKQGVLQITAWQPHWPECHQRTPPFRFKSHLSRQLAGWPRAASKLLQHLLSRVLKHHRSLPTPL